MEVVNRETSVDHANARKLRDGLPLALDDAVHLLMVRSCDGDVDIVLSTPLGEVGGCEVGSGVGSEVLKFRSASGGASSSMEMFDGIDNVGSVGFWKADHHRVPRVGVHN